MSVDCAPVTRRRVLFLCTHNSARSQMAEGFLRALAGDRFEVLAGSEELRFRHGRPVNDLPLGDVCITRATEQMPDRAALVTALIVERPMCEGCIAAKSGCSPTELAATLTAIQMSVRLYRATDRCRACGTPTTVLSVERPA